MIGVATPEEHEEIERLIYDYFHETVYSNLTYNRENTLEIIKKWGIILTARNKNGALIGLGSMSISTTYFEEREADIEIFYVKPTYRGTGVSRALAKSLVDIAEQNGAKVIYSACRSGIKGNNNKLYENLFTKAGFTQLGCIMIRN